MECIERERMVRDERKRALLRLNVGNAGRAYLIVVDAVDVQLSDFVLFQHLLADVLLALGQRVQQLTLHRTQTFKENGESF